MPGMRRPRRTLGVNPSAQLKADNQALVGALRQVAIENRQLRLHVAGQPEILHILPSRPRPPARQEAPERAYQRSNGP